MYQRGRAAPAEGWAVPMPSAASAAPDHLPERRGVPPRAAARAVLHLALAVIALAATACVYLRATIDSPADRCERRGVCGAGGARKKCRAPPSRAERRGHTFFAASPRLQVAPKSQQPRRLQDSERPARALWCGLCRVSHVVTD